MKIINKKYKLSLIIIFVLVVLFPIFLLLTPIKADYLNESTDLDNISIKEDDLNNVEESITFFNSFVDSRNNGFRTRSIGETTPQIAPLSGSMIKLICLDTDIIDQIINSERIDVKNQTLNIYYQSLTETNQLVDFSEWEGEYQVSSIQVDNNGHLNVDIQFLHNISNSNNIPLDNVHYIVTEYLPSLTFVYFEGEDTVIPFYNFSFGNDVIDGIEEKKIYSVHELKEPLSKYVEKINALNNFDDEGNRLFGASNESIVSDKRLPIITSLVTVTMTIGGIFIYERLKS
ncbi:hypothetical protein [Erysipelothrix sp. strain 2 (EsS2-6-Brazil)]|uniref:hypothetical protein n=1 Tax=Erysipelothrix sp. strain 2 (EsS2-6-Brazil) TaxID=2500549 RepID=UPI00190C6E1A|nr:hypothetical protein [Erysipelothrix sp. strain 2 (EsS2-6-Brazil)]MDE8054008.1 hypothetical protein [Erysipelothrix rhusiopathiae]MBK2401664.1 hypothetical protein [Erysipelothrix sp. strain 2 (EsS2-6-Brazil)]MDE8055254.1 hypothetical protein [Erysipelothrix rhusiopathiae]MDE8092136.1 hypothetical protein [Erysipelothrix rhusiopathiae]MDE8098166.1 hypothetical protein [Erysipelothrix rhusiopathiae]